MLEWWQALLVSFVPAMIAALLTGWFGFALQRRQHEAERLGREEDALRALKRERLEPLFRCLTELEAFLGHRMADLAAAGKPMDLQRAIEVLQAPDIKKLSRELVAYSYRVGDKQIDEDIVRLAHAILLADEVNDLNWLSRNLSRVHAALERYAATVGE